MRPSISFRPLLGKKLNGLFSGWNSFLSTRQSEAGNNLSGTLTVTDGTHTASLTPLGQYVTAQFTKVSDGHGGTLIGDPPVATTNTSPPLIAAASHHAGWGEASAVHRADSDAEDICRVRAVDDPRARHGRAEPGQGRWHPAQRRRLEDSDADKVAAIVAARAKGTGIRRIARDLGVGVGTVLRVTGEDA
jgi:hypothetical protein